MDQIAGKLNKIVLILVLSSACSVVLVSSLFSQYCSLDNYDNMKRATCRYKNLIHPFIYVPKDVKILDLDHNKISTLDNGCFNMVFQVVNLSLAHNMIDTIFLDAFSLLNRLEYLNLSNNRLDVFDSRILEKNRNLKILDMSGNNFMNFPTLNQKIFLESNSLEELYLSNSKLTSLSNEIFSKMRNLRKIDLSRNLLNSITIGNLNHLKKLNFINLQMNSLRCDKNIKNLVIWMTSRKIRSEMINCAVSKELLFERMVMLPSKTEQHIEKVSELDDDDDDDDDEEENTDEYDDEYEYDTEGFLNFDDGIITEDNINVNGNSTINDDNSNDDENINQATMNPIDVDHPNYEDTFPNGNFSHRFDPNDYEGCIRTDLEQVCRYIMSANYRNFVINKKDDQTVKEKIITDKLKIFSLCVAAFLGALVATLVTLCCVQICDHFKNNKSSSRRRLEYQRASSIARDASREFSFRMNSPERPQRQQELRTNRTSRPVSDSTSRQSSTTNHQRRRESNDSNSFADFLTSLFERRSPRRRRYMAALNERGTNLIRRLSRSNLNVFQRSQSRAQQLSSREPREPETPSPTEHHTNTELLNLIRAADANGNRTTATIESESANVVPVSEVSVTAPVTTEQENIEIRRSETPPPAYYDCLGNKT